MITQPRHRLKTNVGIRWRWCDKISASELNWKIINDQQRYKELNKYSRGNKSNEQWVWARRQTCNKCREKREREQRNNFIWRSIVPRLNRSDTSKRIETGGQKTWVILQIQAISLIKGQKYSSETLWYSEDCEDSYRVRAGWLQSWWEGWDRRVSLAGSR